MPTAFKQVTDNAISSTITNLESVGVTSIILDISGSGALFPQPGAGFTVTLWDSETYPLNPNDDPNMEQVFCSARSGDTLTISPTRQPHGAPTTVALLIDSDVTTQIQQSINVLERRVFDIADYVTTLDSSTDNTVGLNAAIAHAMNSGADLFISGYCRADGAITPPYTGPSTAPVQKPLRIYGVGGYQNGYFVPPVINGGSVLDLRYNGVDGLHPAKIDTRGAGFLEVDHISIKSGGNDDFQIMQTTNTAVFIHHCAIIGNVLKTGIACVQNFMQFGGTTSQITSDAANAPFQGYGSKMWDNYYSNIQYGSNFGNYSNGVQISNEIFSATCGSPNSLGAPYYFDPGSTVGNETFGVTIQGTIVEVSNYAYAVTQIQKSSRHIFDGIGIYDPTSHTQAGYYIGSGCTVNTIIVGFLPTSVPLTAGAAAGTVLVLDDRGTSWPSQFPNGLTVGTLISTNTASFSGISDTGGINSTAAITSNNKVAVNGTGTPLIDLHTNQSGAKEFLIAVGLHDATSFSVYDQTVGAYRLHIDSNGLVGLGGQTNPTAALQLPAGTTVNASLRIIAGVAPTSPNSGELWFDNTNLKFRNNLNSVALLDDTNTQTIAGIKTFSTEIIVPNPVNAADAANKGYVDTVAQGLIIAGSGLNKTGNTLSVATASVTNAMLAGSIAANNLVGTDIVTVGTIATGTWAGTTIAVLHGGTGVTSSTGSGNNVLSASPTFTGTANFAGIAATGSIVSNNKVVVNGVGTPIIDLQTTQTGTKEFLIAVGLLNTNSLSIYDQTAGAYRLHINTTGQIGIGGVTNPSGALGLPAGTTSNASLSMLSGTAPTSPNDGDMWYDGTNMHIRVGGTTKTFTIT